VLSVVARKVRVTPSLQGNEVKDLGERKKKKAALWRPLSKLTQSQKSVILRFELWYAIYSARGVCAHPCEFPLIGAVPYSPQRREHSPGILAGQRIHSAQMLSPVVQAIKKRLRLVTVALLGSHF
jgi:hypothetical protein